MLGLGDQVHRPNTLQVVWNVEVLSSSSNTKSQSGLSILNRTQHRLISSAQIRNVAKSVAGFLSHSGTSFRHLTEHSLRFVSPENQEIVALTLLRRLVETAQSVLAKYKPCFLR